MDLIPSPRFIGDRESLVSITNKIKKNNFSYQNALDCALRFPDGSGALAGTNLELVGDYPVCFFSFPVVRGRRFKDTLDEWNILKANNEPYINTSGRDLW